MTKLDMKTIIGCLTMCFVASCGQTKTQSDIANSRVDIAIKQALIEKDYRLLVTSSRRVYAPGILVAKQSALLDRCGSKFMAGTGDVVKDEEAREKRKEQIAFMTEYNVEMAKYCIDKTK